MYSKTIHPAVDLYLRIIYLFIWPILDGKKTLVEQDERLLLLNISPSNFIDVSIVHSSHV